MTTVSVAELPQNPISLHFMPYLRPIFSNLPAPDKIRGSATINSALGLHGLEVI